ncbi:aldo/keto reductase [Scytonema hofmannii PCC 7110]|uniref:Aldo/keto reductase n=1 Tax=Scytonema hofmannii PCC 7110 TaxID=128403 RepID=A0A139WZ04_9CYAN|nr:aldo/keto reductase [Scytonema hofmannii]KYC37650.1 aldo/keto reductase [Scytonema hofmannii PCC 7110]
MKITDLKGQTAAEPTLVVPQHPSVKGRFPETNLPFYRKLGRTDLTVSCLGLGGGGHISSEDTMYAFEQGINYFFYSSDLHHFLYSSMADTLRKLCGRRSSVREKVVLATVTYVLKSPDSVLSALLDQMADLRMDYIDVFFWGWIGSKDNQAMQDCLGVSNDLRGPNSVFQRQIERWFGTCERMKKMGIVRYIGASFHDLDLAQQWMHSPLLDVVMVRHNVAHRTAQKKVFTHLDANDPQRPGIVTFKSAGMMGSLWEPPAGLPRECWVPSVPDLYRYSLSQNSVDVALAGWRNRQEVDAALASIQKGKFTQQELDYLNLYGDLHRNHIKPNEIPTERLLVGSSR